MLPSNERLEPELRAGAQVDDRLVFEEELVVIERPGECGAELAAAGGRVLHAAFEDPYATLAERFRRVHRGVRVAEELIGLGSRVVLVDRSGGDRDPDAGGERDRSLPELEGRGQRGKDPLGDALRSRRGRILDEEGELVATEAAGTVLGTQNASQPAGDEPQEPIADRVAEPVVHILEIVEVDEQDGEPVRGAGPPDERVREAVDEEDAVRETGQRIVEGLVPQLLLEILAVADVDEDALHHDRPAVDVTADDRLVVDHPHDASVAGDQSVFPSTLRIGPLEVVGLGLDHPVAIGGVHAADPERRVAHPLLGGVPEQLLDLRTDEMPTTVLPRLGDVDDAGHALDDGSVLRLGDGQLIAEAPFAADDALAVHEQQRLTREHRDRDGASGDGHADPGKPVDQLRLQDQQRGDGQRQQARADRQSGANGVGAFDVAR